MIADYLVSLEKLASMQMEPSQRADSPTTDLQPGLNSMMRCPLPPVSITPDSTRQFYRGGMLPQIRVMSPPPNNATGGSGGGTSTVGVTTSSSTTTVGLSVKQASVTTPILNPNGVFIGVLQIGKVFDLVQLSCSNTARVRLYGTQQALNLDAGRAVDVAPAFGTEQGLILDIVLDTNPLTFPLEGINGSNYDSPQTSLVYVSITNVAQSTNTITATLTYVPLVT